MTEEPQQSSDMIPRDEGGLPSPHLRHSANLTNRLNLIQADFENNLKALDAVIEGEARANEQAKAEMQAKFDIALSDLETIHTTRLVDRMKLRADLVRGIAVAAAGLDKADELNTGDGPNASQS